MRPNRIVHAVAIAMACTALSTRAADIVLTPPAGGGVNVTSANGSLTHFRVDDEGSTIAAGNLMLDSSSATTGNVLKGGSSFIHNIGAINTFIGLQAGNLSMTGTQNSGAGWKSLFSLTSGQENTAVGARALQTLTTGDINTAVGSLALSAVTTGAGNIAIGKGAGLNVTAGNFNIHIGHIGILGDSGTIRIGNPQSQFSTFIAGIRFGPTIASPVPVLIDSSGQLSTNTSSRRFKDDIADMGSATDGLMKLRPVTFHYKADPNPAARALQYGLIAEEVDEVYPELVARSNDGQIETVMYQFLAPMLLNELQKLHRTVEAQAQRIRLLEQKLDLR